MGLWTWRLADYLIHRWVSTVLGVVVLAWFVSGIVMIYYPWPAPTPSEQLARLRPFALPPRVVGFDSALSVAAGKGSIVGARLMEWNGRVVYSLRRQLGARDQPATLVDARSAEILSPIPPVAAVGIARGVVGPGAKVIGTELLLSGDLYLLSNEYQAGFPAYCVRFDDAHHSAVYVSRDAGYVIGVVTDLTRWTTWLGTVPHWLHIKWLYSRHLNWWLWISYVLPAITMIGGLTGIVFGTIQLFPREGRNTCRVTPYRGVSKWHHLTGIAFGVLVVTWSLSGLLEVLGPDGSPTAQQVALARGADAPAARLSPSEALHQLERARGATLEPIAVDITLLEGRPGYHFFLRGQPPAWVDAVTGTSRSELSTTDAVRIAATALGERAPIEGVARLTNADAYYYARPHREVALPVWRVTFADPSHSSLYVDAVSGLPVGFVDTETRWYRWLRDGLHSFDFPGLNGKRPLWDIVLLALLSPGTLLACTGLWLVYRRIRRRAGRSPLQ